MIEIPPLRTEADYDDALKEMARHFACEPRLGTADAERFDMLAQVIADYEARHWPVVQVPAED